jgi:hypothetical protein
MSRPLKLKVIGTVLCRFSNSPITGYRVVCGGAPQTFSLPSGLSLLMCLRSAMYALQPQGLVRCKPVSQKTGETGCWILGSQPVAASSRSVFWTIDVFPTRELAEHAKGSEGTVIVSLGKVWLLTVGDRPELNFSARRASQIGLLVLEAGRSCSAQFMEATLQPGMVSKTHLH